MRHTPLRVLKLGGSLLARDDWPRRFRDWIRAESPALNLLIVGGGELIESVRELDRVHHFDQRFTHWLCIDLLASTLRIASQLLPELPVIADAAALNEIIANSQTPSMAQTYLVHLDVFYSRKLSATLLPEDWTTTSDALAALLAQQVQADELVLFKSTTPPSRASNALELVSSKIVDEAFAAIWDVRSQLRLVNLATTD